MDHAKTKKGQETREKLIAVGREHFTKYGYGGASTRKIASEAEIHYGVLTYHFKTKKDLWKAVAESFLVTGPARLLANIERSGIHDELEQVREEIKMIVRHIAEDVETVRFLFSLAVLEPELLEWVADQYLSRFYQGGSQFLQVAMDKGMAPYGTLPSMFYALLGASSFIFVMEREVRRSTGIDPLSPPQIEAHAENIANLFAPLPPKSST